MAEDLTPIVAILRKWPDGHIIALFPEEPADLYGRFVGSYSHVGQHGDADYDHVIASTKPVLWWDNDVLDLLKELKAVGYKVDVRSRRTPAMRAALARNLGEGAS